MNPLTADTGKAVPLACRMGRVEADFGKTIDRLPMSYSGSAHRTQIDTREARGPLGRGLASLAP